MPFKSYRDESRVNYGHNTDENITLEQLQAGALLRIADATEKMCLDREKLERDYRTMKRLYQDARDRAEALERSNSALRGVITKLRKRHEAAGDE